MMMKGKKKVVIHPENGYRFVKLSLQWIVSALYIEFFYFYSF